MRALGASQEASFFCDLILSLQRVKITQQQNVISHIIHIVLLHE
jgi:hypothetical protein